MIGIGRRAGRVVRIEIGTEVEAGVGARAGVRARAGERGWS